MVEGKNKLSSHCWWLGSHSTTKLSRSTWLQSTLEELDEKTKAMLKVIEEDADSFAQRAEMYYKKRPELISMVEDFYRAHRSLAERYDQVKSDSGTRLLTPWASPLSFSKYRPEKTEKSYDSYSETYDHEESGESEVEDPEEEEEEEEKQYAEEIEEEEVSSGVCNDEMTKLREAIEELKEENIIQKEELLQKDEEKREAIRQLSLAVDMLKEENSELRKKIAPKKQSPFEFNKLKGMFWGRRLFNESPNPQASVNSLQI